MNSLDVEVYPNPFRDELTIEVRGDEKQPLNVTIYDVLGKVVYEKDYANIYSIKNINLNFLINGMYSMKVSQGDEVQHIKINKLN
jgi:hypothetical protein